MSNSLPEQFTPRVRRVHTPARLVGRVKIGGHNGVAKYIKDPQGWVWTMLQAMDGSIAIPEIAAQVSENHPNVPAGLVRSAIIQLWMIGFLENTSAPPPERFTPNQLERYSRSKNFFDAITLRPHDPYEAQEHLQDSKVAILGTGGVGGALAVSLAATGVGHIHVVDCDIVELSNLNRQFIFTEKDAEDGRSKVDATVERLRALNSDIQITGQELRLNKEDDFHRIFEFGDFDAVAVCIDEPGNIRQIASRAFLQRETPILWGEGGYEGPRMRIGSYLSHNSGCFECMLREDEAWLEGLEGPTLEENYAEYRSYSSVIAASAVIAGNLLAWEFILHLTDITKRQSSHYSLLDLRQMSMKQSRRPVPISPLCSQLGPNHQPNGKSPSKEISSIGREIRRTGLLAMKHIEAHTGRAAKYVELAEQGLATLLESEDEVITATRKAKVEKFVSSLRKSLQAGRILPETDSAAYPNSRSLAATGSARIRDRVETNLAFLTEMGVKKRKADADLEALERGLKRLAEEDLPPSYMRELTEQAAKLRAERQQVVAQQARPLMARILSHPTAGRIQKALPKRRG